MKIMRISFYLFISLLVASCSIRNVEQSSENELSKPRYVTKKIRNELNDYILKCTDFRCLSDDNRNNLPKSYRGFEHVGTITVAKKFECDNCLGEVYRVWVRVSQHGYFVFFVMPESNTFKIVDYTFGELN
jgi:hypothetical protein